MEYASCTVFIIFEFVVMINCICLCHMMTSSNGNNFRVTGPLCGEFTGPDDFPAQRPVTRSFDVFFGPIKRLSKQPWGWWFETPSWSLWRQCNEYVWKVSSIGRYMHDHKTLDIMLIFIQASWGVHKVIRYTRYNITWYDMIWHDMTGYMIWYDMIWYDMTYDMIWYMIWNEMKWYDMIWYDMIWYDMKWYEMICDMWYVMCDVMWRDVAWRGVAWRGVVWHDMAWQGMAWLAWHDMDWHGKAWHDIGREWHLFYVGGSLIEELTRGLLN